MVQMMDHCIDPLLTIRALQDRGASARDEGHHEGSSWPPTILFSMVVPSLHALLIAFVSF